MGDATVGGQRMGVAQDHVMFDGLALGMNLLYQWQKGHVEAQHLIFSVVGDPDHLIRMESRIDGVQYPPGTTDTEIQLQMPVAVPGQRRHPVAGIQAQCVKTMRDLPCASGDPGPIGSVDVAFDTAGHDFGVAMMGFRMHDQGGNVQGHLLHQSQHG